MSQQGIEEFKQVSLVISGVTMWLQLSVELLLLVHTASVAMMFNAIRHTMPSCTVSIILVVAKEIEVIIMEWVWIDTY